MREELKQIDGLRKEFKGIFVRFGQKTNFKGYPEKTVLIQDIKCTGDARICCDHLWFNFTKEFQKANLQEGDVVRFCARVKEYIRGYKGHRFDDEEYLNEHPIEKDYKLSHPTKFRKEAKPIILDNNPLSLAMYMEEHPDVKL